MSHQAESHKNENSKSEEVADGYGDDVDNNEKSDHEDENDTYDSENDVDDSSLTPEEIKKNKSSAAELKNTGNVLFKDKKYDEAREEYTKALRICPSCCAEERAVLFSNRAACYMGLEMNDKAIKDCNRAIKLNPSYVRALARRAKLYETTTKLDEALEDYKKIVEIDPGNCEARAACMRLPEEINVRNEKMKDEFFSSLKELGNKILGPFGLSTNNFQVQKDPNSGSYSINFKNK